MRARLASRRVRRTLAAAALFTVALPTALLVGGSSAGAAPTLDVYAVKAGGAGVRITVQTGYSFVVEPDAMIPRAAATIEANAVSALASPLDPGDSVDALPGVGVPTAEQDIMNGAATPNPLPSPIGGQTPPPQFTQTVDGVVTTYVAPFNPLLTVPYEHAVATYPNATGAPQRAVYPPPVPTSANGPAQAPELPDFADPLGLLSVHSTLGEANAGPGNGVADSGIGSAVSIPALGLTIGRISSHVEVRGGGANSSGAATSTVVTTLQDVDLTTPSVPGLPPPAPLPSGTALLHIGTLVLTATTERTPGAAKATSKSSLEASGVTVAGQTARLDENGLTVLGQPSPLNPVAQTIVNTLSSPQCTPNPPIGVPNLGTITSQPVMKIGLPQVQSQVTHGGNEAAVTMTGPTLCVAGTAPIPGTNGQVAATPTVYTVTLGDVSSSAYGISFPAEPLSVGALPPPMPETGVAGSGSSDTSTIITSPGGAPAQPPTAPSRPVASRGLVAILTGGILSPRIVVTVASLAELALLATLWLSYRLAAAARAEDTSPTQRMDMV